MCWFVGPCVLPHEGNLQESREKRGFGFRQWWFCWCPSETKHFLGLWPWAQMEGTLVVKEKGRWTDGDRNKKTGSSEFAWGSFPWVRERWIGCWSENLCDQLAFANLPNLMSFPGVPLKTPDSTDQTYGPPFASGMGSNGHPGA